jgi:hydrogenase nickel incorporation protein HypB
MIIEVNKALTAANDALAARLREELRRRKVLCLNLVSAPGSGKTALVEQIVAHLGAQLNVAVIVGDPHTDLDRRRIEAAGAVAVQINTQSGCHLDAAMIRNAIEGMKLDGVDLLIIENVGNLLCPTFWDLGEHLRVVVTSLPEGADKPLKYPEIFLLAHILVINKIDLEGLLKTTIEDMRRAALLINPRLRVFTLSCTTGRGIEEWCRWLLQQRNEAVV